MTTNSEITWYERAYEELIKQARITYDEDVHLCDPDIYIPNGQTRMYLYSPDSIPVAIESRQFDFIISVTKRTLNYFNQVIATHPSLSFNYPYEDLKEWYDKDYHSYLDICHQNRTRTYYYVETDDIYNIKKLISYADKLAQETIKDVYGQPPYKHENILYNSARSSKRDLHNAIKIHKRYKASYFEILKQEAEKVYYDTITDET